MPAANARIRIVLWGILLLILSVLAVRFDLESLHAAVESDESGSDDDVLAIVDGRSVTREEVEQAAAREWEGVELERLQCEAQAAQHRHEVLERTVERLVRDRLVDADAKVDGVAREPWIEQQMKDYMAAVGDEEVDRWYQQNRARIGQPKEQIAEQIRSLLANGKFIQELKARHDVSYQIEPYRVEVEAIGPGKGPAEAPVTIVEFSDFECPFCKRVNPTLEQVTRTYGEQVRVVFRQYPLAMHANAHKAAEAALCADDQGRFWEMHDLLFAQQQQLGIGDLKEKAARLELDTQKFNACLDSGERAEQVQEDSRAAARAGVSGTPALFVNGRFINGAVPFDQIAAVIDDELRRLTDKKDGD